MTSISIFTPTHDPSFLPEVWESIKGQPFKEWIVLHNGPSRKKLGIGDYRVREIVAPACPPYAGAAKRMACAEARGDVLLELDHDDTLLPGAVEKTRQAFEDNPQAGFVYSNTLRAHVQPDGTLTPEAHPGWAENGWQFRPALNGLEETVSFAPTPASVSRVWFAPDHLRAFRRDLYEQTGGHNPSMRVLDDQDLMARMFTAAPFVHLNEPLYLYRVHGQNSWIQHNAEIQQNVMRLYGEHITPMLLAWAKRERLAALDLGGRFNPAPGFQSVDLHDADIEADLTKRWPWPDSSVGVLRAADVFEHLPDKLHVMRECYRVLAPGGWLLAQVPSTDGRGAFQDPTHRTFWNENDWLYWTDREFAKFIDTPVRFQAVVRNTTPADARGVCWTVFHGISLKGGHRPPGIVSI